MIEWSIPYTLTSPQGTLVFNQETTAQYGTGTGYQFLLDPEVCKAGPGPLRLTVDGVPQAHGSIIHPSFKNGYTVKLGVRFWKDGLPACDDDLRVMWDTLILHLYALENPDLADLVGSNCRLVYRPSGYFEDRMANQLRLVEWPDPANPVPEVTAQFTLQTELPYETDAAEISASVGGSPLPYPNSGNSETYPVYIVNGPASAFTIQGTDQQLVYDSSLPGAVAIGGGDYVEINTFRNTVYLNGSGANRKSGIDVLSSDFFPLQPGSNTLSFTGGASCTIKYNYAWAN